MRIKDGAAMLSCLVRISGIGRRRVPFEITKRTGFLSVGPSISSMRPLVICGPSGSGKSTLLKRLLAEHSDWFSLSVSHTTRKPRPGEVNGRDYHFVSQEEMQNAIDDGEFIEHTEFSGNMYGTSKSAVRDVMDTGRICVLDVEIEGVKNIKNTDLRPHYVFVKPPSLQVLEERLRCRGTETEDSINLRLSRAVDELAYGEQEGNFDLLIVNDNLKTAYETLENFLKKEYDVLDSQDVEDLTGKKAEF